MTIDVILCGGTIDKKFFPEREAFDFEKTHIQDMMDQARLPEVDLNVRFLFLKDSLDMDDRDRERVVRACKESVSQHILILHGTSTMVKTAQKIEAEIIGGKTIVLFGAMLPYELAKSDAMFNFGAAMTAVQILPEGVYIAMNGKTWAPADVVKDEATANFLSKK